jgi:hypothetical protein
MELEEAIKILKEDLEHTKRANECGLATKGEFNKEIKAIETVLKYLEKYRDLYMQSLANNLNQSLKNREMSNEQLEALNEGWKLEVEKKDKMIELMARFIDTELSSEHLSKVLKIEVKPLETYREDIKQYFEKKAEESE